MPALSLDGDVSTQAAYSGGDTVRGTLKLRCSTPCTTRSITVLLKGREKVCVSFTEGGELAARLLELGAECTLDSASALGSRPAVEALLAGGAAPDGADAHGRTGLMKAAAEGHTELLGLLLSAGASVERRDGSARP